jgi:hypothetical protein
MSFLTVTGFKNESTPLQPGRMDGRRNRAFMFTATRGFWCRAVGFHSAMAGVGQKRNRTGWHEFESISRIQQMTRGTSTFENQQRGHRSIFVVGCFDLRKIQELALGVFLRTEGGNRKVLQMNQ